MTRYGYCLNDRAVDLTGTAAMDATGTAVTGSGTAFLSEVKVGDVIHVAGYSLTASVVTSNTALTLATAPPANFTGQGFTVTKVFDNNVESAAGYQPPRSTFQPWTSTVELGDGTSRAMGRPIVTWLWGYITRAQRDALRVYCTGKSAAVYIRTRKNDSSDAYVTYKAIMIWPDEEDRQTTRRVGFVLTFKDLVAL